MLQLLSVKKCKGTIARNLQPKQCTSCQKNWIVQNKQVYSKNMGFGGDSFTTLNLFCKVHVGSERVTHFFEIAQNRWSGHQVFRTTYDDVTNRVFGHKQLTQNCSELCSERLASFSFFAFTFSNKLICLEPSFG